LPYEGNEVKKSVLYKANISPLDTKYIRVYNPLLSGLRSFGLLDKIIGTFDTGDLKNKLETALKDTKCKIHVTYEEGVFEKILTYDDFKKFQDYRPID